MSGGVCAYVSAMSTVLLIVLVVRVGVVLNHLIINRVEMVSRMCVCVGGGCMCIYVGVIRRCCMLMSLSPII